ncbi:hypothetical protein L3Q82_002414 [Scortum barcoo]|uniref:Uncharacterized protein n=1 Tax=Scortum barcoo TaxID=214431 RepID=A0ACB8VY39_9TELE|nr:hypothetical protein L3Q82_002414 [Scortum barcoo]
MGKQEEYGRQDQGGQEQTGMNRWADTDGQAAAQEHIKGGDIVRDREVETVDGYQQAKQATAQVVLEAKTPAWEEFGEAMEEDYQLASKKFWQTVCMPSASEGQTVSNFVEAMQCSANTVYSAWGGSC